MTIKSMLALLLAMALCLAGASFAVAEEAAPLAAGDTLADFTWTACDGVSYTLSEALQEKELALLIFWSTQEDASTQALSLLQEAYGEVQDRVLVLAMACDDDAEALQSFVEGGALSFPVGQDSVGLAERFAVTELPTIVAVDQKGVVQLVQAGSLDSAEAWHALLESLLSGAETEDVKATAVPPAPKGMSNYTLLYVDQNGDPVEGLIANICDDSSCTPMFTDAKGTIFFQYPSFAYHIQVIRIPEGYEYDLTQESYLEKTGGTYTYVIQKN